jgi:release factor glutamine methyltransferase
VTLREALRRATERLDRHGLANARLNAETLLAHCLSADRTYLYTHDDRVLTGDEQQRLEDVLYERIAGTPVQYIVGRQEFFGRNFVVSPSVLIPRPESELIVEAVLELQPSSHSRIIDVGTGSGCIGITLALELPQTRVTITDVSFEALRTAQLNAAKLGANVEIVCMDLLDATCGPFDLIVSNLPYVPLGEAQGLQREVRDHEPSVALFGGEDGLAGYRRLIPQAARQIRQSGYFIAEIGFGMEHSVLNLLGTEWVKLPTKPDLQGIPRTVCARRA